MVAIGFIDDDPNMQRLTVRGLPVVGTFKELPELCEKYAIEEVIITSFKIFPKQRLAIQAVCNQHGIQCREFKLAFSEIGQDTEAVEE